MRVLKTGGRRKGTPNKLKKAFADGVAAAGVTPLEYMLNVMRDETAEIGRRDEMARAAAPFMHARLSATDPGKSGSWLQWEQLVMEVAQQRLERQREQQQQLPAPKVIEHEPAQ
jgi:hypothetical protein